MMSDPVPLDPTGSGSPPPSSSALVEGPPFPPSTFSGPDTGPVFTTISFLALMTVLRRSALPVGLATILVMAVAALALAWIPPRYRSEATLIVKARPAALALEGMFPAVPAPEPSNAELASQINAIVSAPVLEDAAAKLNLDADPEFNPLLASGSAGAIANPTLVRARKTISEGLAAVRAYLNPAAFEDSHLDVLSKLSKSLDISQKGSSHTISVQATARDPWKAANIANAVAEAAVARELAGKAEYAKRLEEWLGQRLHDLKGRVSSGEEDVERLRTSTGRFEGQTAAILSEQLSQVSRELLEARGQLVVAQAKRNQVAQLGSRPDGLSTAAEVLASQTVHSLREQEAKLAADLAAAESKLAPQHPLLISLRSQLSDVRGKIAAETKRITHETSDRVGPLQFQVAALERARAELQARIEGQGVSSARLKELQRDADDDRSTYTTFAIFRAKMDGLPEIERSSVQILSPASPSPFSAWPNRKSVLLLAGLGTLGFGVLVSFLRASLDQGLRSVEQVGALLGLETVALIPRARGWKSRRDPAGAPLHSPDSALAESVRHLYAAVTAARPGRPQFKVLVASALPHEGKTTTSLMLARQAALAGEKALLVRLDLRDAGPADRQDSSEYVDISQEAESGLSVLSVRTRRSEALKVLHLFSFWQRLKEACASYDLVIIDSPPVLSASDSKMIARFAQIQMTIFVVKWGTTKVAAVGEALRQLRSVGSEVPRIVLTQVDPRQYATHCYGGLSLRATHHKKIPYTILE